MAKLRTMVAVGAIVGGSALGTVLTAIPASAAGTTTAGQCVNDGGGTVFYNVDRNGYSDGHGVCRGGRYNGQQIPDPSGQPSLL